MDQLLEYFRKLSEGEELDITKTVEYQFIKTLQEMDTPVGLQEFANKLKMTSIVSHLMKLMTKAGLIRQGPEGISTNIRTPLSPKSVTATRSTTSDSFQGSTQLDNTGQTSPSPGNTKPNQSGPPSPSTTQIKRSQINDTPSSPPPSPTSSSIPNPDSGSTSRTKNNDDEDLPFHIQEKLDLQRSKIGSKKTKSEMTDDELDTLFNSLGSIEDDLEEE